MTFSLFVPARPLQSSRWKSHRQGPVLDASATLEGTGHFRQELQGVVSRAKCRLRIELDFPPFRWWPALCERAAWRHPAHHCGRGIDGHRRDRTETRLPSPVEPADRPGLESEAGADSRGFGQGHSGLQRILPACSGESWKALKRSPDLSPSRPGVFFLAAARTAVDESRRSRTIEVFLARS